MNIVKCDKPVQKPFLVGHIYQGKSMKQLYLGMGHTERVRLLDLQKYVVKDGRNRDLYNDVTDKWELKEVCGDA